MTGAALGLQIRISEMSVVGGVCAAGLAYCFPVYRSEKLMVCAGRHEDGTTDRFGGSFRDEEGFRLLKPLFGRTVARPERQVHRR